MSRPQKHKAVYQLVIGIWLTLSIASVALSAISWIRVTHTVVSARQWSAVAPQVDGILGSMLDSETSARGFVLTGNTSFLGPYSVAQSNFEAEFDELAAMTAENSNMLKAVVNLRAQCEMLADFDRQTIDARKLDFSTAQALIASGKGEQTMNQIREQVAALDKNYFRRKRDVREELNAELSFAIMISLIAGIIGITAGVLAFWLARVTIKNQERERKLIEAMWQAERSSREKSAFLANMSHEIRTPMNAILGFTELLQSELRGAKHHKYLQSIRSSAASLLQLINDVLDMSKIEAGVMELRPEPTDSREICDFMRTLFSEQALKKGIKLECHMAEDLPRALVIDRLRFRQILVNLVGNALKFTDRGGVDVRFSIQKQADGSRITLIIEVIDTGVGIPQDRLDAVFKPFTQAGAHRDKEIQGTGLGLSIVKRLTEMMGGHVAVTSIFGQGSHFSLYFPNVAVTARLPASAKISRDAEVDFNQLRPASLLVVDDNEANRQYIAGIFETTHHRLVFCSTGAEALIQARRTVPDILLLDMRMPGMDGHQTLAQIRKIPGMELVPAIAVTASTRRDGHFSGHLSKPFSIRDLFNELAEFLPRHVPSDPPAVETSAPTETPTAPVPPELLAQLRELLVEPWPSLCNTMAVNETKTFARRLEILAEQWQCKVLMAYAGKLLHDAETYAITDLEKHLGEFAGMVEQFGQKQGEECNR